MAPSEGVGMKDIRACTAINNKCRRVDWLVYISVVGFCLVSSSFAHLVLVLRHTNPGTHLKNEPYPPAWLPVLWVVPCHAQADFLPHREPPVLGQKDDVRRLERVVGREEDPAVVEAAPEGAVRGTPDGEVPVVHVLLRGSGGVHQ